MTQRFAAATREAGSGGPARLKQHDPEIRCGRGHNKPSFYDWDCWAVVIQSCRACLLGWRAQLHLFVNPTAQIKYTHHKWPLIKKLINITLIYIFCIGLEGKAEAAKWENQPSCSIQILLCNLGNGLSKTNRKDHQLNGDLLNITIYL